MTPMIRLLIGAVLAWLCFMGHSHAATIYATATELNTLLGWYITLINDVVAFKTAKGW